MKKIIPCILLLTILILSGCWIEDPSYGDYGPNMNHAKITPNYLSLSRTTVSVITSQEDTIQVYRISAEVAVFLDADEVDDVWIYGTDFDWQKRLSCAERIESQEGIEGNYYRFENDYNIDNDSFPLKYFAPYNVYHLKMRAEKDDKIVAILEKSLQIFVEP